ncbi:MAG: ABC transporter permease [Candidatus Heimdallarchaeaceae archaeon]
MGLRGYVIKRIIYTFFLIIAVLSVNFIIFYLMPGDPVEFFMGRPGSIRDPELVKELYHQWGFDVPLHERYFKYIVNMLTFQFGHSNRPATPPVMKLISERLPNTLLLMGVSTFLAIVIGVIFGVVSAHKRGGYLDTTLVVTSLLFFSLPVFWIGMMLIGTFAIDLKWFPPGGIIPQEWVLPGPWPAPLAAFNIFGWQITIPGLTEIAGRLRHLFLPVLTLTLFQYGNFLLLTRASMLECLTEDYVITARAKGVKERIVLFRHALKNASLPIITSAAIYFGSIISGAIITETVFNWPGIGLLTWKSIATYDYPVLHVLFYIMALCVIIANFIADLLYGVIDPRIRY